MKPSNQQEMRGSTVSTRLTPLRKLTKSVNKIITGNKLITAMKPEDVKAQQELVELRDCLLSEEKGQSKMLTLYKLCYPMPFFKKLSTQILKDANLDVYLKFFEKASYEKYEKGTVLIKENDTLNSKAYVILKGRVGVVRKTSDHKKPSAQHAEAAHTQGSHKPMVRDLSLQSPDFRKVANSLKLSPKELTFMVADSIKGAQMIGKNKESMTISNTNDDKTLGEMAGLDKKVLAVVEENGVLMTEITKGNMFGEVALTENVARTASIITLEDTELMVFTRKNFQHIQTFYAQDFIERSRFLKQKIPNLDELEDRKKSTHIVQSFQPITFQRVAWPNLERNHNQTRQAWQADFLCP